MARHLAVLCALWLSASSTAADTAWRPSAEEQSAVVKLLERHLTSLNAGRYEDAYQLLTPGLQQLATLAAWSDQDRTFRIAGGGSPKYWNAKATWYNDPPTAQLPGVYVAFDLDCSYANIKLCHEILIFHRQSDGSYRLMRHEQIFIDKTNEAKLRAENKLESAWSCLLTSRCTTDASGAIAPEARGERQR